MHHEMKLTSHGSDFIGTVLESVKARRYHIELFLCGAWDKNDEGTGDEDVFGARCEEERDARGVDWDTKQCELTIFVTKSCGHLHPSARSRRYG